MEAILSENPDYIMFDGITFDIGFNLYDSEGISCDDHFDLIRERDGFKHMNAVKNNTMIIMSGDFAGPMMIHGLPTLAKIFHPELFDDLNPEVFLVDYFNKYHNIEKKGKFVCNSLVAD
jgi:iron complex transport system substrate-binding protein